MASGLTSHRFLGVVALIFFVVGLYLSFSAGGDLGSESNVVVSTLTERAAHERPHQQQQQQQQHAAADGDDHHQASSSTAGRAAEQRNSEDHRDDNSDSAPEAPRDNVPPPRKPRPTLKALAGGVAVADISALPEEVAPEHPPAEEYRRWLIGEWPKVSLDKLDAIGDRLWTVTGRYKPEGHSGQLTLERQVYMAIAARPEVKRICEIGFNSGHSASTWLLANPTAEVLMFDLWAHRYARKAEAWLRSRGAAAAGLHNVSARLQIVKGSSLETVPQFFAENPGVKCNILSVDGGHTFEIATRDIRSMRMLVDPTYHVLLIDDSNCEPAHCVDPAIDEHVSRGSIRRILGYSEKWHAPLNHYKRGITVLQYVLNSPHWRSPRTPATTALRYGSFRDVDVSGYLELRAKLVAAVPDAAPTAGGDAPDLLRRGVYAQLARMPGVRRVCLLGFQHAPHAGGEGGHPALLWLWANPTVEVLLFESDAPGVAAAEAWLGSDAAAAAGLRNASARVERVSGPSNQVLMDYIGQHPDVQCDVIAVDGGRGTTQRDLRHLRYYARSEANLLAVEDTNCEQAYCVDAAIEGLQRQGELTPPLLSLTEGDGAHGITVLSYT